MEPVTLRTDRLELSAPEAGDADAVFAACQDTGIQRYTSAPTPFARADADELIAKARAGWASGEHLVWAIRADSGLIGIVGLYRVDGADRANSGTGSPHRRAGGGCSPKPPVPYSTGDSRRMAARSTGSSGTPSSATTDRRAWRRRSGSASRWGGAR